MDLGEFREMGAPRGSETIRLKWQASRHVMTIASCQAGCGVQPHRQKRGGGSNKTFKGRVEWIADILGKADKES